MTDQRMKRMRGMFIGLAVGDALGAPVEFHAPGDFEPVTGMRGYGTHNLPPGYWTDDSSMALCLADSLLQEHRYDSFDVMNRYQRWAVEGYRSSTGVCFDIGNQVSSALVAYERSSWVSADAPRTSSAGNGSIMRLAPVVIAAMSARQSLQEARKLARISARETHYSVEAEDATEIFAEMLFRAVDASSKDQVLPRGGVSETIEELVRAAGGLSAQDVTPSGYVLSTLQMAVWAFMTSDDFASGALICVNSGGDSDTVAAVYGQLAGAYYGLDGIPPQWLDELVAYSEILSVTDALCHITRLKTPRTRFEEDHTSSGARGLDHAISRRKPLSRPARVRVHWTLGAEDLQRLTAGSFAEQMEDKWHVYLDEGTLHCQRSWTGYEIYRFDLIHDGDGAKVQEFLYETDRFVYSSGRTEEETETLRNLLRGRLGVTLP